jgi:hypothetical protein
LEWVEARRRLVDGTLIIHNETKKNGKLAVVEVSNHFKLSPIFLTTIVTVNFVRCETEVGDGNGYKN